jgi:stage IV sporulation protein B
MKLGNIGHKLIITAAVIISFALFSLWQVQLYSGGQVRIHKGQSHYVNLRLPFLYVRGDREDIILLNGSHLPRQSSRVNPPYNMQGLDIGEVNLEFSLFGKIPLHQITVSVLPKVYLVPGGHSIGIKLNAEGVDVVGFYYFDYDGQSISPAREAGVQIGDIILSINGEHTSSVNRAAQLLENLGSSQVALQVGRNGKSLTIHLDPVFSRTDHSYRIGLYIRDSAAGVGTLSFYIPETRRFGALGHAILSTETNRPINISNGSIVKAKIVDIKTARRGQPGEKTGIFMEHDDFAGNIDKNSSFGIFGNLERFDYGPSLYNEPMPMALACQVETGPAEILTVVEGEEISRFSVEIEKITHQARPADKGIVLRVTDEELLKMTGGIVQGMSGSPIIQNGRLAGAITHVFVNDPTRGYGIFMEWMYQEAVILTNN